MCLSGVLLLNIEHFQLDELLNSKEDEPDNSSTLDELFPQKVSSKEDSLSLCKSSSLRKNFKEIVNFLFAGS